MYMIAEQKRKIYAFIAKQPLAVISTCSGVTPSSALIAFAQNDDLELYIMIFKGSRKYVNLQRNVRVSLVIGFDYLTVQYDGEAVFLPEQASDEARRAFERKTTPCTSDFLNDPRATFLKIHPKWIRYSDYTLCPAEIFVVQ